jgi:hypothetical protein
MLNDRVQILKEHEKGRQPAKRLSSTVRVTRYARKIVNFETARLAYSGARDGYRDSRLAMMLA